MSPLASDIGGFVAHAFEVACRAELLALKPGNVHVHAPGHGMSVHDFELSAASVAPAMASARLGVGARILTAVTATRAAVGQNTNLGIVLLAAPLASAVHAADGGCLRTALRVVLRGLAIEDTRLAYAAIRLASPGGLGRSERHDVAEQPRVTLLEAMREAAARDRIAFQYANDYVDVFGPGRERLVDLRRRGWSEPWAVTGVYLGFLAAQPDLHIGRKHGPELAEAVRREAAALERRLLDLATPTPLREPLLDLDERLKLGGVNPGTSADLTVATHFADALAAHSTNFIAELRYQRVCP